MDDGQRWDEILTKIGASTSLWQPIEEELSKLKRAFSAPGASISGSEVEKLRSTWLSERPLIDSDGRQFVLYIYDQAGINYGKYRERYGRDFKEYKFHVSWCNTLQTMTDVGRRGRYKAKYDIDNVLFPVHRGGSRDEKILMRVCKTCLSGMSYEGYAYTAPDKTKDDIYNNFQIDFFFQKHTPVGLLRPTHQFSSGRYPDNWSQISRQTKVDRGNKCEDCPAREDLQVHHINGVKDDCRSSNLKVLCYKHHAAQPLHDHMRRLK